MIQALDLAAGVRLPQIILWPAPPALPPLISHPAANPRVAPAIARYDELWSEWRQLRADHPDTCASLYTDRAFGDKPGMGAAIDRLRRHSQSDISSSAQRR